MTGKRNRASKAKLISGDEVGTGNHDMDEGNDKVNVSKNFVTAMQTDGIVGLVTIPDHDEDSDQETDLNEDKDGGQTHYLHYGFRAVYRPKDKKLKALMLNYLLKHEMISSVTYKRRLDEEELNDKDVKISTDGILDNFSV